MKCFKNCDHTIDRVNIDRVKIEQKTIVFVQATKTKHCRLGGSNSKHLFSHSSKA